MEAMQLLSLQVTHTPTAQFKEILNMENNQNLSLILQAEAGKKSGMSTSEALMIGLALCKPSMLKRNGYTPRAAWLRLDDKQRAAIVAFSSYSLTEKK